MPANLSRASSSYSPLREALKACGTHLRYALLFSALVNIAYLAPTFYMLAVYDMVVPSGSQPSLVFVTIALCFALFTLTYLDKARQRILLMASARLDKVFSARIFRRAMLDPDSTNAYRVNQLIRDFDTVRSAITGPAALAMFDAPWIPLYIVVCFYIHAAIGTLALGGAVVLFSLAIWNERSTRAHSKKSFEASAASFAAQDSAASAADVVRALGMANAFVRSFETARARANTPQIEASQTSGSISSLIRFLRLLLQSAALGLGAWLAMDKQVSAGAVFASSMLATRALAPIDQIVAQWRVVAQAITAYGDLRAHIGGEEAPASQTTLPPPEPTLLVRQLSVLTPTKERVLLRNVSFAAKGGQVVCVVGPSGAGKTTLMQTLVNARRPEQGEIRISGAQYSDWDSQRLARYIGYLPQDCVLFPGTVKDNISRFEIAGGADPAKVDERAIAAAKTAGVHELILGLPGGYDSMLGPRGRGLSAGQQQRIALARALYGDPVLVVLDEPNSNLDSEGETALMEAIASLKRRGALVIVAAHRVTLINAADTMAVLRGGQLESYGPRLEVLEYLKKRDVSRPPGTGLGSVGAVGGAR